MAGLRRELEPRFVSLPNLAVSHLLLVALARATGFVATGLGLGFGFGLAGGGGAFLLLNNAAAYELTGGARLGTGLGAGRGVALSAGAAGVVVAAGTGAVEVAAVTFGATATGGFC